MSRQSGFSMIEVLITLVVVMLGLLGLVGLQAKTLSAEMESYERQQALSLLNVMSQQIRNNARAAACYSTVDMDPAWVGTGGPAADDLPVCALLTPADGVEQAKKDLISWQGSLLGSAETVVESGKPLGAMIDARGCVLPVAGTTKTYLVTVTWTGLSSTAEAKDYMTTADAGGAAIGCAAAAYADLKTRRAVSAIVQLPDLDCVPTAVTTNCE